MRAILMSSISSGGGGGGGVESWKSSGLDFGDGDGLKKAGIQQISFVFHEKIAPLGQTLGGNIVVCYYVYCITEPVIMIGVFRKIARNTKDYYGCRHGRRHSVLF